MIAWIIYIVVVLAVVLYCWLGKSCGHVPDFRKPFSILGLVVYTIIMLIFCSCGSSKSLTKQNVQTHENAQGSKNTSDYTEQKQTDKETEDVSHTSEVATIEYDTSLPVNPNTGKPPVKRETHRKTTVDKNKQKQCDIDIKKKSDTAEKAAIDKKAASDTEASKQLTETTVPKQIGGMVWAMVALGVVVIVGFVVYRIRRTIRIRNKDTPSAQEESNKTPTSSTNNEANISTCPVKAENKVKKRKNP